MASDERDDDILQLGLVRMQAAMAKSGERAVVVLEGRDAAGKDGTIKAITKHLSARNTRVVALPKPNDRERTQWYFQRYVAHLPAAGELVIFNRSWYNRAGVEVVNGFSSPDAQARFLEDVSGFEAMLVADGIKLVKLWLDISRDEQAQRLKVRRTDPLKALKVSPLDAVAEKKFDDYTEARDQMLRRTHSKAAPWTIVRADRKKAARLNIIRHLLRELAPGAIGKSVGTLDPPVVFPVETAALTDGWLHR